MKFATTIISIAFAISMTSAVEASTCNSVYGQCGGIGWTGATCCESGSTCVPQTNNKYYSQCLPGVASGSSSKKATKTTSKKTTAKTTKKTTKKTAITTKKTSSSKTTTTSTKTKTSKSASTPTFSSGGLYSVISGGASGSGTTTRYWDCCKASCSWPGKASVTAPVDTCAANGISLLDENTASACADSSGTGYMCNNNQPFVVNDNLAYGFAAATISGETESDWCCGCYELTFTSDTVAGKKFVVQVTNTGGDLGSNQFDLQIPGGGVGLFNGCASQWGAPASGWGSRYGGVSSVSECSQLPSQLQAGCKWRFGWFANADNPSMTFKQVTCPTELVQRSGCQRT